MKDAASIQEAARRATIELYYAYQCGQIAGSMKISADANPYPRHSPAWHEWRRGYDEQRQQCG